MMALESISTVNRVANPSAVRKTRKARMTGLMGLYSRAPLGDCTEGTYSGLYSGDLLTSGGASRARGVHTPIAADSLLKKI